MASESSADVRRFPIRIGPRSKPPLLLLGVRERNAYVELSATEINASFGFYHLRVPLTNVARWSIEGPWLWLTAIGVRRGILKGDLTFGGNHKGGVRLDFSQPLRRSILSIPCLYVTVGDLEGLGQALTDAGISGEDKRQGQ